MMLGFDALKEVLHEGQMRRAMALNAAADILREAAATIRTGTEKPLTQTGLSQAKVEAGDIVYLAGWIINGETLDAELLWDQDHMYIDDGLEEATNDEGVQA